MAAPFVYYFIHNSHTDIGYTDYQEKVEKYHIYYIKEAVEILNAAHSSRPEWLGFKWNCESYFCVERFLDWADERYREDFIRYVRAGEIGLSGSYLNLNEIVDKGTLFETMAENRRQMAKYGVQMRSALTCDINGYSWGFADALYENGVTRLLTAIHAHHGYHPLGKRQQAFWWQSPKGNKVLVWIGEHYHLGNELGIARQPSFEYIIRDGLDRSEPDLFVRAEKRLENYKNKLRAEGYNYDFVPVNVSGMMTDNGSPNASIADFCRIYNEKHDDIKLKMATLDEFFDLLEETDGNLPTYSGDFTDWWADGAGSTPADVQHYREAVRKLDVLRVLDPEKTLCGRELFESARRDLMTYAEHTWGFCASVSSPCDPLVNGLDKRKSLYACRAHEAASRALDNYTFAMGETPVSFQNDYIFTVINPSSRRRRDVAQIPTKGFFGHDRFRVVRAGTDESVPYQIGSYARGPVLMLDVTLDPKEIAHYELKELSKDEIPPEAGEADAASIDTPALRVTIDEQKGIASIYDKNKGLELTRKDAPYPPFTPIYEVTPMNARGPVGTRGAMGRSRRCGDTVKSVGKIKDVRLIENGALFTRVEIGYELDGTEFCSVILTVYKCIPRVDADLKLHKKSVWEPENLYLSLPFTAGDGEEFFIEKTAAVLRPRVDQIPGTCTDFFAVQSGMAFVSGKGSTVISTPDTPLVTMGKLEVRPIVLAGEPGAENIDEVYAWVMNNFWETNFKVDLGGFYQFRDSLVSTNETDPHDAIESAKEAGQGLIGFPSFTRPKSGR